jgi:hypothetical protein
MVSPERLRSSSATAEVVKVRNRPGRRLCLGAQALRERLSAVGVKFCILSSVANGLARGAAAGGSERDGFSERSRLDQEWASLFRLLGRFPHGIRTQILSWK